MHLLGPSQRAGWLVSWGGDTGEGVSGISQRLAREAFCEEGWQSQEMSFHPDSWRNGDSVEAVLNRVVSLIW